MRGVEAFRLGGFKGISLLYRRQSAILRCTVRFFETMRNFPVNLDFPGKNGELSVIFFFRPPHLFFRNPFFKIILKNINFFKILFKVEIIIILCFWKLWSRVLTNDLIKNSKHVYYLLKRNSVKVFPSGAENFSREDNKTHQSYFLSGYIGLYYTN